MTQPRAGLVPPRRNREPEMSAQRLSIGVMGTSGGVLSDEVRERSYRLGRAIAEQGAVLITGACPGLPYEAVRGAKAAGGLVVGISPGLSMDEHRGKYHSPVEGFDVLIYTGSGLMGREITNIRSCDIVVIVGGRTRDARRARDCVRRGPAHRSPHRHRRNHHPHPEDHRR
jgi:uncharacterized protein (TIGR00725 family)